MARNTMRDEKGMAMVIALLLMVLVTIIGIRAIDMTVYETSRSGDENVSTEAYHGADRKGSVSRHVEYNSHQPEMAHEVRLLTFQNLIIREGSFQ